MSSETHRISTISLCAITVLVFAAGALTAGWAVGKFSTTGNSADWVAALSGVAAAIGTWFIGIGANRYAREAHLQRLTEQAQLKSDALDGRIRRFNVMLIKVRRAANLKLIKKEALQAGLEGPLHLPSMLSSLNVTSRIVETLKWAPEETLLLNTQSQKMLNTLEGRILAVSTLIEFINRSISGTPSDSDRDDLSRFRSQFNTFATACEQAHDSATALSPRLEARIEELNEELVKVQAQLVKLNSAAEFH